MKLHLHVKTEYFKAVKHGDKTHEFRLGNEYWTKRIHGKTYDGIVYYNAYKTGSDNRIEMPWNGYEERTIVHPHFGPNPVFVYAIRMTTNHNLVKE